MIRNKQESSTVERRVRKPALADVVLSDVNSNNDSKSGHVQNNVPNKVMESYLPNIQKKIVVVKVTGRPTEKP